MIKEAIRKWLGVKDEINIMATESFTDWLKKHQAVAVRQILFDATQEPPSFWFKMKHEMEGLIHSYIKKMMFDAIDKQLNKSVADLRREFNTEKFIDEVVERIKRKQLK